MHYGMKIQKRSQKHHFPEQRQQSHENKVDFNERREQFVQNIRSFVLIIYGCFLSRLLLASVAELLLKFTVKQVPVVEDSHFFDH